MHGCVDVILIPIIRNDKNTPFELLYKEKIILK
jgi:hypothetical protein